MGQSSSKPPISEENALKFYNLIQAIKHQTTLEGLKNAIAEVKAFGEELKKQGEDSFSSEAIDALESQLFAAYFQSRFAKTLSEQPDEAARQKVIKEYRVAAEEQLKKLDAKGVNRTQLRTAYTQLAAAIKDPKALGPSTPVDAHIEHHTLKLDRAIEKWKVLRDSYHQNFRFTRYNTGPAILWGAAVPIGVFLFATATKDRWNWTGALAGQSLLSQPPPPPPAAEEE